MKNLNLHKEHCPWYGVDLNNDDQCDQMDDTPCNCDEFPDWELYEDSFT